MILFTINANIMKECQNPLDLFTNTLDNLIIYRSHTA